MFEPLGPSHLFTRKFCTKTHMFFSVTILYRFRTSDWNPGHNLLLSRAFSMGIPLTVGFRPQLVVVSSLSVVIPLMVGFRPQLVVSGLSVGIPLTVGFSPQLVVSGLSVGIPLTVGFRLSRSLCLLRSLFHKTFLPLLNSQLPQSLFSQSFSYDGIQAITEPL
jgi:predicted membrane protein